MFDNGIFFLTLYYHCICINILANGISDDMLQHKKGRIALTIAHVCTYIFFATNLAALVLPTFYI